MTDLKKKSPEILRTAHGDGAGALIRAEVPPISELPPIPHVYGADTGAELTVSTPKGARFAKKNDAAKRKRPALAGLGVTMPADHPEYAAAMRKANAYRKHRVAELSRMHGCGLSAGVCSMIASSARALAASQLLHDMAERAIRNGQPETAAKLISQALAAADKSRQQELTALALCEREASSFRKANPVDPLAHLWADIEEKK